MELFTRGLLTRRQRFTDADGRCLVSCAAVSEIAERLWQEYAAFTRRDLSEFGIVPCKIYVKKLQIDSFQNGR